MESMSFEQFMVNLAGCKVGEPPSESEKEEIEAGKEAADMEADTMIEMLKRLRDEYSVANDQMEKTIEKFGTFECLSGSGKVVLSETADMLQKSSVVDINSTNVFLQQTRMALDESKFDEQKRHYQNCAHQISSSCSKVEKRTEELMRDMQFARDEFEEFKKNAEAKVVETKFYGHEVDKYKKDVVKLQVEEQRLGLFDSKEMKDVLERVEAIADLKAECKKLKVEIEQYDGLPPNLEQAEAVLSQTVYEHTHKNKLLRNTIERQRDRTALMMSHLSQQAARKFK